MSLNSFQTFTNEEINGLKITGIAGRDRSNAPVWAAICTFCGTSGQTFPHKDVLARTIHCKAAHCGKPVSTESRATAVGATEGTSVRNARSRTAFNEGERKIVRERPLFNFDPWAARVRMLKQLGEI